ncbi:MAG: hypothetical protein MJZ32_00305 [Bacteroidaceae bacterium]|nr:hypothetical protein [Bacteroidaceae bacterium]
MKKLIITLFVLLFNVASTFAIEPSLPSGGIDVSLSVCYEKPTTGKPISRIPMRRPIINVTESVITVPENLIGYELEILSDGMPIYSGVVTSTEILLPEALQVVQLLLWRR